MTSTTPRPSIKVGAIVPAAGGSQRMGRPKLLLPFADGTIIGQTTRALSRGGADRVLIVAAPRDAALQSWAREQGRELTVNPDPSRGMLSSIQRGLEALGGPAAMEALLVCPGDYPLLQAETVARVLDALAHENSLLVAPVHRHRRGHPLAIARHLIFEIPGLDASTGLRQLLLDHPEEVRTVEVDDPGTILDLDTPADYRRLRALR